MKSTIKYKIELGLQWLLMVLYVPVAAVLGAVFLIFAGTLYLIFEVLLPMVLLIGGLFAIIFLILSPFILILWLIL